MPAAKVYQQVDIGPGVAGRIVQTVNVGTSSEIIPGKVTITAAELIAGGYYKLVDGVAGYLAMPVDAFCYVRPGAVPFDSSGIIYFYLDENWYWETIYGNAGGNFQQPSSAIVQFARYETSAYFDALAIGTNMSISLPTTTVGDGEVDFYYWYRMVSTL